ncbi:uncharacterized protein LOC129611647 isoform X2 [Condylostylus longicornis]|uniref:uncharacterized protein LOC129611647 isoform X2 n=1 Tax=Condylostylus longicornis TaxID=2530218 RepID=UPI00244DB67E|nr:uncharacterized protein LOC129611647 isoform X2 [Condylostylus longicornis]
MMAENSSGGGHVQQQQQHHNFQSAINNTHVDLSSCIKQEIKQETIIHDALNEDNNGDNIKNNSNGVPTKIAIVGKNYTAGNRSDQQHHIICSNNTSSSGGGGGGGGGSDPQNYSQNSDQSEQQHYYITTTAGAVTSITNGNSNNNGGVDADSTTDGIRNIINNSSVTNHHHQQQNVEISTMSLPPPQPPQQQQQTYSRMTNVVIQQSQSQSQQQRNSSPTNWHQPTSTISQSHHHHQQQVSPKSEQQSAFGMLRHENDVLYITESCIDIGRNSSTSSVHFHVAKNSFVSRKHFQVLYDADTCDFYLNCLSKNGVFVDDVFQRRSAEPLKLPKICTFRFPSTEIRIYFENFTEKSQNANDLTTSQHHTNNHHGGNIIKSNNLKNVEHSNVIYSPLKISIPKAEQKSPFPSPTGTISAANSCPTSPRHNYQEYQNYSNYNNNNNSLQNELFPPPSTSYNNEHEKPPYSYAQLIVQSISAAPDKQLTLSGIYSFISKHYPYYRKEANKGWQNSIRHNLSLNRYFIKVARSQDEPGKGSFWRIDPNSEAKLIDQSYKKRRQRGSQCFRQHPYDFPPSADNSRESSPLHDIVLQSAPGSPGGVSYQNHHNSDNHGHEGIKEIDNYSILPVGIEKY